MEQGEERYSRSAGRIAAAAFLLAALLSLWLHRASALHDTDSYFHLAIARLYAQEGVAPDLPALRMSLMRDGYGDKEFLFHWTLAPLAGWLEPLRAGRLALAVWAGLIAALLAALASRAIGRWALLFPFWLFFASTEWAWRLVRLRPELLSLALLLAAAWAIATRRDWLLGAIAAAYSLGYTAFQAFQGLVFLCFVAFGLLEAGSEPRRWPWRMLLYSWIGGGLGLIAHPHFPKNLLVWWVQNVVFFQEKANLEVGTEIRPNSTDVLLMVHLGLFAAAACLWLASRRSEVPRPAAEEEGRSRLLLTLGIFAGAFGVLYLLMSRFSVYFWPFATLALLFALTRGGREIGDRITLGGRKIPLAWGLAAAALLSAPEAWRQLLTYQQRTSLGPGEARIKDREQLAAELPPGAKVAADWGPTATYLLWAPQARYLNALDPAFMAVPYPEEQATLRRILDGEEVDVPGKVAAVLDSEYLAFPAVGHEKLIARLKNDPRARLRHRGSHLLVQFREAKELVTGWQPPPPKQPLLPGYVDGDSQAPGQPCVDLSRNLEAAAPRELMVELAVQGRATLRQEGKLLVEAGGREAILGEGVEFPLRLEAGVNRLTLRLCTATEGGSKGFFWRETVASQEAR
jgi:hypothetical protein